MKPTRVAFLSALGMLLTSVTVYSFTPPGGVRSGVPINVVAIGTHPDSIPDIAPPLQELSRFSAGSTLTVEGRVGNPRIGRGASGETFVMLEVRGSEAAKGRSAAPINLSLVIDRSGSMKGTRLRNAISAATTAVDRLSDGDVVDVVTFDTQVQTVVAPTTIGPGTRDRVASSIRGIGLGGDTCISCGLEQGMQLLEQTTGKVNRMILLSDGDANHGIRDIPGFRSIAQRAMSRGISITTIGVDVDYNEKIMAAIAQDSNGRHYFVENDAALARVFEAEAESLASTIASGAEVAIDLAPGVELERVFDRSFRRVGDRILVPLGTFAQTDVKTVLLKVKVPSRDSGIVAVAGVEMSYRDLAGGIDGRCNGKLALEVTNNPSGGSDLDPVVNGRVQRSETAATIKDANDLFGRGKVAEAQRVLSAQQQNVRAASVVAARSAPAAKADSVRDDFQNQLTQLGGANSDFAAPPASPSPSPASPSRFATPPGAAAAPAPPQTTREGKSAVKSNEKRAFDLAF